MPISNYQLGLLHPIVFSDSISQHPFPPASVSLLSVSTSLLPRGHYVKRHKSDRERQIPDDITHMWNLKNKINEQTKLSWLFLRNKSLRKKLWLPCNCLEGSGYRGLLQEGDCRLDYSLPWTEWGGQGEPWPGPFGRSLLVSHPFLGDPASISLPSVCSFSCTCKLPVSPLKSKPLPPFLLSSDAM